jgi:hypothetical protein
MAVKVLAETLLPEPTGDPVQDEASLAGMLSNGVTPEIRLKIIEAESKVKDQVFELQKLTLQLEHDTSRAELSDIENARERDKTFIIEGTRNYRADVMFGLAFVAIIGFVWMIWTSENIDEYTKGIFTLVLGRLLGYIDTAYQFEFGSTRTSKSKDETIKTLTNRHDG